MLPAASTFVQGSVAASKHVLRLAKHVDCGKMLELNGRLTVQYSSELVMATETVTYDASLYQVTCRGLYL